MKRYYVDAVEQDGIQFLAGPFASEAAARMREIEVARWAMANGYMSPFASFGVSSVEGGYDKPGKLNRFFDFAEGELIN